MSTKLKNSQSMIDLALRAMHRHEEVYGKKIPEPIWNLWKSGELLKYEGKCVPDISVPSFSDEKQSWRLKVAVPSWEILGITNVDISVVGPGGMWEGAKNFLPLFHAEQDRFFVVRIDNPKFPVGYFEEETFEEHGDGYYHGVYKVHKSLAAFLESLIDLEKADIEVDDQEEDVWKEAEEHLRVIEELERK